MRFTTALFTAFLLTGCQTMQTSDASKPEILAASQAWSDAFNACDVPRIVALFDREAVAWGTVAPGIAATPEAVRQYFLAACSSPAKPKVAFGEQRPRVFGDMALNSGSYTFSVVRDGKTLEFPARFSFAYRRTEGNWLIVDFHSSARPAPPKPAGG